MTISNVRSCVTAPNRGVAASPISTAASTIARTASGCRRRQASARYPPAASTAPAHKTGRAGPAKPAVRPAADSTATARAHSAHRPPARRAPAGTARDLPLQRDALWLAAHQTSTIAQSYVRSLGAIAFILFAIVVADTIRRRLDRTTILPAIALVGGVLSGSLLLLAQVADLSAALETRGGGSPAVVHAMGSLSDGLLTLSSLPAALLFGAAASAFLRTRVVPSWLAYLTLAGVPFAILDAASYDTGPVEAVGFLGLVYFLVWSAATSIALVGQPTGDQTRGETPALA